LTNELAAKVEEKTCKIKKLEQTKAILKILLPIVFKH
jgi:hypothetical protein